MKTNKFWHWPDRQIGKKESRRMRDEHNKLANEHSELLAVCEIIADEFRACKSWSPGTIGALLAVISKVKGESV